MNDAGGRPIRKDGSEQVSNEVKPQFALCSISHREKLLEYVLDLARDLGFEAIEIWGREPHINERFDENRTQAARRMIEERQLAIAALGSYVVFGPSRTRPEELVELEDVLHTARCLRCPLVRVWASDVGAAEASRTLWDRTVGEIQEACDRAQRLGIVLAADMHDDTLTDTGESALRLLEAVERDNFRLSFHISGRPREETPEERLEAVCSHVVHVQVQNFSSLIEGEAERPRRASIADGLVDWYPLLERLAEGGYRGYHALAFAACEGDGKREALAQDLHYLKSLFKLMGVAV
ncbi:MAG: sugar phosphate isomerase/epimerase [candidate division WS1 bacterium]|jgi:sugar phosphate isomerase/epimerase|nr:sugar phosphate isomerase/epimerase [candidate division WS1 bacterium]